MRSVAPPDCVRAVDLGPVIVVVNYLTGGHHTLSEQARDLWRVLATTGNADTAAVATPAIDIVEEMMRRGLLAEVPTAQPWPLPVSVSAPSWGTVERAACLPRLPPTSRRWALAQVWLKVLEPNAAAIRAYEQAGFHLAGRLRQAGYWHGQRCDELLMDALPADFPGPSAFS